MPNTENLEQALKEAGVTLPGEGKVKVVKKTEPTVIPTDGTPYIEANDIVVSDTTKFHLPESSYTLVGLQARPEGHYIVINYSSVNHLLESELPERVVSDHHILSTQATPINTYNTVMTKRDTDITNNIQLGKPYYIRVEDFIAMNDPGKGPGWEFNNHYTTTYNSDQQHPGVKFSLAVGPIHLQQFEAPGVKTEMTIFYNNAPAVNGPTVVYNFSEINAFDSNGDFVPAFEVKLVNENLIGKVGLRIYDSPTSSKTYPIGQEGVRFSQADRVSGNMRLVRLDGFIPSQKGLAVNHIRVNVRACDEFAWGESESFHMAISK